MSGVTITIAIAGRCTACGVCIVSCPEHALAPAPRRPSAFAWRCTGCLACVEVCPVDALDIAEEQRGGAG